MITIGVLVDGSPLLAHEDDIFARLDYFLETDETFMMNTMKIFSEELIAHVLLSKSQVVQSFPLLFKDLKPAGFLVNLGNYFNILNFVNHLDPEIASRYNPVAQYFNSENDAKSHLKNMETTYFSCKYHQVHQICPRSLNSTFLHNFLHYLAVAVRLAGKAYISDIYDAPKWIAVEIAATICRVHERLLAVGGWKALKLLCENFTANPMSVESIHYVDCQSVAYH